MLTQLPGLVLDLFLHLYATDHDLRRIHQVSTGWRDLVVDRPAVNARRLSLVARIQQEKENIRDSTQAVDFPEKDLNKTKEVKEDDSGKPGSRQPLSATTNLISSASSTPSPLCLPISGKESHNGNSSTPKSHFQRRIEAVGKLVKGQVLFSCPDCKSPVPSPVISRTKKEKPVIEARKDIIQLSNISEDSGISFSSPVAMHNSGANQTLRTPDFINISIIATPPPSPSPSINMDGVSELQISETPYEDIGSIVSGAAYEDIASGSINLNDSMLEVSSSQEINQNQQRSTTGDSISGLSTEYLRDGNLYNHYSRLFNSPLPTLTSQSMEKSTCSSLPVNDSLAQSMSMSSLVGQECFTQTLPELDLDEGNSAEEVPYVVECPDCSYRFCSRCEFKEHTGKPCRLIGGLQDSENCDSYVIKKTSTPRNLRSSCSSKSSLSRSPALRKSKGGSSGKQAKKSALRRLAKLH